MGHLPPVRSSAELAQLVAGIDGIYHPESQEEYFIATLLDAVDTPHDPPAPPTPPNPVPPPDDVPAVPGPAGVMGAAAALDWSRRLRRRIG